MASKYLTDEKKAEILKRCGPKILTKIRVEPLFMSRLVAADAIDPQLSTDIQDLQVTSDKRNRLLKHFEACSLLQFISACEVLYYKEDRDDIVVKDFGLNMESLEEQKKQLLREKKKRDNRLQQGVVEDIEMKQSTVHEQVTKRSGTQSTQQQSLTVNGSNTMERALSDFGHRPVDMIGPQTPVVAANTALSTSTFHEVMRKRLKLMNDALAGTETESLPRVRIAVLDTGMYAEHPRLKAHIKWWKSVFGDDEDLHKDCANHGTVVAGILADFANRCIDIINIKVKNEGSSLDALHNGFKSIDQWEKQFNQKVDIVLTSINEAEIEGKLEKEFDTTLFNLAQRMVIVCSAANRGAIANDTVCYPATSQSVLAIGSVDEFGNRSRFSSQGPGLDFMFQGEQFLSTSRPPQNEQERQHIYLLDPKISNDWVTRSAVGTSFAAPQCAASLAVILSYTQLTLCSEYRQKLTGTEAMRRLLISVCEQARENKTGFGLPRLEKLNAAYIKDQLDKM